jgi:hypothetical protein
VLAAAQQLATALKGNIPAGNKTAEALTKVSALFARIAETKLKVAAAKSNKTNSELTLWQGKQRSHHLHE